MELDLKVGYWIVIGIALGMLIYAELIPWLVRINENFHEAREIKRSRKETLIKKIEDLLYRCYETHGQVTRDNLLGLYPAVQYWEIDGTGDIDVEWSGNRERYKITVKMHQPAETFVLEGTWYPPVDYIEKRYIYRPTFKTV